MCEIKVTCVLLSSTNVNTRNTTKAWVGIPGTITQPCYTNTKPGNFLSSPTGNPKAHHRGHHQPHQRGPSVSKSSTLYSVLPSGRVQSHEAAPSIVLIYLIKKVCFWAGQGVRENPPDAPHGNRLRLGKRNTGAFLQRSRVALSPGKRRYVHVETLCSCCGEVQSCACNPNSIKHVSLTLPSSDQTASKRTRPPSPCTFAGAALLPHSNGREPGVNRLTVGFFPTPVFGQTCSQVFMKASRSQNPAT